MAEYVVRLPDVGEGVAEAEVVEWHVAVGDIVTEDDVLADVMSDKATVELPSPVGGVVAWLGAEVGDRIAVGSDLVKIDTDGDLAGEPAEPEEGLAEAPEPESEVDVEVQGEVEAAVEPESAKLRPEVGTAPASEERPASPRRDKPLAAPAVRARSQRLGVDLATVTGTGRDGHITHADLDAVLAATRPAIPRAASPAVDEGDAVEAVKLVGLRRNIAERMQASKRRIPHFSYVEEIDVTELDHLRTELNAARAGDTPKLSVLPFIMRAVVRAVAEHPAMNARFDDEAGVVERHRAVHLGIAVQTPRGLMVPVVTHAGSRDLWHLAAEVARLSEAARTAKISLPELTGSTITITSLGALGGIATTPVINAPEVAIVGVNKIVTRPVYVDGVLVPRQIMNLSSSFDHRVVDGADGAEFVQTIRWLLETPALLFT